MENKKRNLSLPLTPEQMQVVKSYQVLTGKSNVDLANDLYNELKEKYKQELLNKTNTL